MRVGYVRVSTIEQNTARQEVLLECLNAEKVFIDKCLGKNTDRPALKELLIMSFHITLWAINLGVRICVSIHWLSSISSITHQTNLKRLQQNIICQTSKTTLRLYLEIVSSKI